MSITVLGVNHRTAPLEVRERFAHTAGEVPRSLERVLAAGARGGVLLFRGPPVFAGYWRNEEATAEVLERDGWFHTGDVGEIDEEGFVRITGRMKEILVTAGGKNVAPSVLEDRVRAHFLVSQCLVVGDGRPFIAALVPTDQEPFAAGAHARGKPGDVAANVGDADLREEVQRAVDDANAAVSRAESI